MNLSFLTQTDLFAGIPEATIADLLPLLEASERTFQRGETIMAAGERAHALGLLLDGAVTIEHDDIWGQRSILDHLEPGDIFAETYAVLEDKPMLVSAVAMEPSVVLFLNVRRLFLKPGEQALDDPQIHYRHVLMQTLFKLAAEKNLTLSRRIIHTSPKTIRQKLFSYLSFESVRAGSERITLPFNRQQMADYLGVDRSALSAELGRMKRDGLIDFHKNVFDLRGKSNRR